MTKKDLQSYRQIKREIRDLETTMRELNTRIYSPRIPKLTGLPTAASTEAGSAQERAATALFELRERYTDAVARLYRRAAEIETAIELLRDPLQRRILRMRYIDGRSWTSIAHRANISESYALQVHGFALHEISKI